MLLPLTLSPLGLGEPPMRKYSAVECILIHWEGEALDDCPYGPTREAQVLAKTLAEWGWQTEDYIIPLDDPVESVKSFLKSKTEGSTGDELLVVYYVGHGSQGSTSQPFAVGRQGHSTNDVVVLEWPVIRSVLEAASSDVVVFLNCCHGADAWVSRNLEQDKYIGPAGKVMCILAAANKDELAFMDQQTSFGTLLKRVLDSTRAQLSSNKSISITTLVHEMKVEIEKSNSFWVADIVRGGYATIYLQHMDPCAHYPVAGRDILLHMLSLHILYVRQGNTGNGLLE